MSSLSSTTCFMLMLALAALPGFVSAQTQHTTVISGHHHLSLFTGGNTALGQERAYSNQTTWFSTGFDYEYRIIQPLGVSVFVEYLFAPEAEFLFGLPVFVHPYRGLKFNASPLLALVHEIPANDAHATWHKEYGFRVEGAYDFSFDHYTITPLINYDRVEGHDELNYGIAIGMGF